MMNNFVGIQAVFSSSWENFRFCIVCPSFRSEINFSHFRSIKVFKVEIGERDLELNLWSFPEEKKRKLIKKH